NERGSLVCDDEIDADGDGEAAFATVGQFDTGCSSPFDTSELSTLQCDDGIDNDGDGFIDDRTVNGDPGCSSTTDDDEHGVAQCDDGLDNDTDGKIDAMDPQCTDPTDASEAM
ncbi:MAG TPA: hypothetical protein VFV99_00835, partial [Kofleriaceae bacterium]|nr:hypothetical protein [Kofleriaceae bacterium]